jgi:hypothetical protein
MCRRLFRVLREGGGTRQTEPDQQDKKLDPA